MNLHDSLLLWLSAILLIAAINDIRFSKIPNLLTYPVMAAACLYHSIINGLAGFLFSAEGIVVGIALLALPYIMGGMGAGDAKLMGAVGGILGPRGVFIAFLFTAFVGGLYAMAILLSHGFLKGTLRRYGIMLKNFCSFRKVFYIPPDENEKKPKLRYGIAIAAGTMLSVLLQEKITEFIPLM